MAAPKVVQQNPNATAAAGGSGAGVLLVWVLSAVGADISPEAGAAIAGAIATVVLYVGRNGVKGTFDRIWKGDGKKS